MADNKLKSPIDETAADPGAAAPDPFNAKALRLPPAFEHNAGVRKVISTIPVRKPHSQEWIRVHSGEDFSDNFGVIILKEENEYYLLHPNLVGAYENEMTRVRIFTVMSMNKNLFMWPCKLPGSGHKNADSWNNSAIEAAEVAMKRKARVQANKAINAYEYSFSDNPTPENDPVWPELPYDEMIRIAFVKPGRFVDSHNHEVDPSPAGRLSDARSFAVSAPSSSATLNLSLAVSMAMSSGRCVRSSKTSPPARSGVYAVANLAARRRFLPDQILCSSPTMPAQR